MAKPKHRAEMPMAKAIGVSIDDCHNHSFYFGPLQRSNVKHEQAYCSLQCVELLS